MGQHRIAKASIPNGKQPSGPCQGHFLQRGEQTQVNRGLLSTGGQWRNKIYTASHTVCSATSSDTRAREVESTPSFPLQKIRPLWTTASERYGDENLGLLIACRAAISVDRGIQGRIKLWLKMGTCFNKTSHL